MRTNSLRFRLLVWTALLVAVILPLTAFVLTSYYRHAMERSFDQRLKVYLDSLVAASLNRNLDEAAGTRDGEPPLELPDPSFKQPFSGWYWQVSLVGGGDENTLISDSLLDQRIETLHQAGDAGSDEKLRRGYVAGPEGQQLRVIEQIITTREEAGSGPDQHYSYVVAVNASELGNQVAQFRNALFLALGMLGLGLILAGVAQTEYGLAPLKEISRRLADIRSGKVDRLSGTFPAEIEPLQVELNALIRSNREIVERSRTHVGNLAHALKTPLSVIANEIDKAEGMAAGPGGREGAGQENITRQVELMRALVRHHLDRARMAAQVGIIGNVTKIEPVLASLVRTLQKIHRDRPIAVDIECPHDLAFRGEKQDLEEMLGNLLDNAFKYTISKVAVKVKEEGGSPPFLLIFVGDDGPGLTADKRAKAMQRGQRLDEKKPGSGLGLSIVADLADLYEGGLHLVESELGGLQAELRLPQTDG